MLHLFTVITTRVHAYNSNYKKSTLDISFVQDTGADGSLHWYMQTNVSGTKIVIKCIVDAEELPAARVTDNEGISYTKRIYEDFNVHYFVNTSAEREKAVIPIRGKVIDIYTGKSTLFRGAMSLNHGAACFSLRTVKNTGWGKRILIRKQPVYFRKKSFAFWKAVRIA